MIYASKDFSLVIEVFQLIHESNFVLIEKHIGIKRGYPFGKQLCIFTFICKVSLSRKNCDSHAAED